MEATFRFPSQVVPHHTPLNCRAGRSSEAGRVVGVASVASVRPRAASFAATCTPPAFRCRQTAHESGCKPKMCRLVSSSSSAAAAYVSPATSSVERLHSEFLGGRNGHRHRASQMEFGQQRCRGRRDSSRGSTTARLFGPAIFKREKLNVVFPGHPEDVLLQHPAEHKQRRKYTLTHSDMTSELTLAVSMEFNIAQMSHWYKRFHRDEVLAMWKTVGGPHGQQQMELHVHCHISGDNWLHRLIASLRYHIFRRELPVVLEAFMNGDRQLLERYPDLEDAEVWVHYHSCMARFHHSECYGPLKTAAKTLRASEEASLKEFLRGVPEKWPLHHREGGSDAEGLARHDSL